MSGFLGLTLQSAGAIWAGYTAKQEGEYNKKVSEYQANVTQELTKLELARIKREGKRNVGSLAARLATQGVGVHGTGAVLLDNAYTEFATDYYAAAIKGQSTEELYKAAGAGEKYQGTQAFYGSLLTGSGYALRAYKEGENEGWWGTSSTGGSTSGGAPT